MTSLERYMVMNVSRLVQSLMPTVILSVVILRKIVGNHAYNIKDSVKGRVGGDRVVTTEKSSVDIIAGQYKLSVEGKKMDSNPNERGVHIKSSKDYLLDVNGNLSQSTISGIVSIKSGSTLNIKSALRDHQSRDNTNANRWYGMDFNYRNDLEPYIYR